MCQEIKSLYLQVDLYHWIRPAGLKITRNLLTILKPQLGFFDKPIKDMGFTVLVILFSVLKVGDQSSFDEYAECRRDAPIQVKEGQRITLTASVKPRERCIFKFQPPASEKREDNYECCFGLDSDCEKHKWNQNNEKCQGIQVESKHSTCSAFISSVNEGHFGWYKVFDANGDHIQTCFLDVKVSSTNIWKIIFFITSSMLFLFLLLCILIVTRELPVSDEHHKVLHLIKRQLQRMTNKL